jgi:hypothetical protein
MGSIHVVLIYCSIVNKTMEWDIVSIIEEVKEH